MNSRERVAKRLLAMARSVLAQEERVPEPGSTQELLNTMASKDTKDFEGKVARELVAVDEDTKAYRMINSHKAILKRLLYWTGILEDNFKFAEGRLDAVERSAGKDRAILEARETFMPGLLENAEDMKKLLDEMVKEMKKAS